MPIATSQCQGEIPLHIEADTCLSVKLLLKSSEFSSSEWPKKGIKATKEMLRLRDNKEENTFLHNAARYGHLEVVRVVIESNPDFLYTLQTKNSKTPLYMVARREYHHLVVEMLNNCKSMAQDVKYFLPLIIVWICDLDVNCYKMMLF